MSDLAEGFRALKEHRKQMRNDVEPSRMQYAKQRLSDLGYSFTSNDQSVRIIFKNKAIVFWPYTGWFQGCGISGRGIDRLLTKLNEKEKGK